MKSRRLGMLALVALVTTAVLSSCGGPGGSGQGPGTAEGTHALTISVDGPGSVAIDELGIDCRNECTARLGAGVEVELLAQPDSGKGFVGWEQACSGPNECTVLMDADLAVRAIFANNVLALLLDGDGDGSVRMVPPDITCSEDCGQGFDQALTASLSVSLGEGSVVKSWGGACDGNGTRTYCQLQVQGQTNVTLTLASPPVAVADNYSVEEGRTLTVGVSDGVLSNDRDGNGDNLRAELVSEPSRGEVDLRSDGSFSYTPDSGALDGDNFSYRAVDESGNRSEATGVSIAILERESHSLTVTMDGAGRGKVSSEPTGIDCPDDCNHGYKDGTTVTLTAAADSGSEFDGWGGACSGASGSTCVVSMDGAKSATASFGLALFKLDYKEEGAGSGTVTFDPPGSSCSDDCSKSYDFGDEVTLSAQADEGWIFEGWSGDCEEADQQLCRVEMSGNRSVAALFGEAPPEEFELILSVTNEGGKVTSQPAGLSCSVSSSPCSAAFEEGTSVVLSATAADGYEFGEWGGDCDAIDGTKCEVVLSADSAVSASFSAAEPVMNGLSVSLDGQGSGEVVSSPAGIDCSTETEPDGCSASFDEAVTVELTPSADQGSGFAGWSGDCGGNGRCKLKMSEPRNVGASFEEIVASHSLRVDPQPSGGLVASDPAGIECGDEGDDCEMSVSEGDSVLLTATPGSGFEFLDWTGACSAETTERCELTVSDDETLTARFEAQAASLQVKVSGNGSVSSPSGQIEECRESSGSCRGEYEPGTVVSLDATPDDGHLFDAWTGCEPADSQSCSLEVTEDSEVAAAFKADPEGETGGDSTGGDAG